MASFTSWLFIITDGAINIMSSINCKVAFFCYAFFRHFSSALLVIMSVEKFFVLYFPLKTKGIFTVKRAKWISFCAFLVFFIFNLQMFFTIRSYEISSQILCLSIGRHADIYQLMDGILYCFGPFIIMGTANIAIIFKFLNAKLKRDIEGAGGTNQALSKAAMRGTAILITVSLTFIILTGPLQIMYVFNPHYHNSLGATFFDLMSHLNHAINSVLYCIVGSKFRKELLSFLNFTTAKNQQQEKVKVRKKSNVHSSISSNFTTDHSPHISTIP